MFKIKLFKTGLALALLFMNIHAKAVESTTAAPIYFGIYPESIEVAYGATAQTFELQFYVVNQSSSSYNLSGFTLTPVNPPSPHPITVTSYTTDCGGVLKPAGSTGVCNVYAHIEAQNLSGSPINYNFQLTYGARGTVLKAPTFPISFATGAADATKNRTMNFVNNCAYDVWFGITSGAIDAITPNPAIQPADPKSCLVDTDCYPGSKCLEVQPTPLLKHCLWDSPAPTMGTFKLSSGGGSNSVQFPFYDNGIETIWNGGVGARVGCDDMGATPCKIADCGAAPNSGDACPVPSSFANPATQAEFTFLGKIASVTNVSGYPSSDTYDITVINGVTVPTAMEPTTAAWGGASDPYTCGGPGRITQTSTLGACEWFNQAAESADYVWVDTDSTGGTCNPTACNMGQTCGHTVVGQTVSAAQVCGTQLGYLTRDAVCAIDKDFGAPFNCDTTVNQGGTDYTLAQIYGCSSGDFKNSCYSAGATAACCGCQDWWDLGVTVPEAKTQSCGGLVNSYWKTYLLDTDALVWLKELCPTAYVYPFDDASSTFSCQALDSSNVNVVDYTVTFCPTT